MSVDLDVHHCLTRLFSKDIHSCNPESLEETPGVGVGVVGSPGLVVPTPFRGTSRDTDDVLVEDITIASTIKETNKSFLCLA